MCISSSICILGTGRMVEILLSSAKAYYVSVVSDIPVLDVTSLGGTRLSVFIPHHHHQRHPVPNAQGLVWGLPPSNHTWTCTPTRPRFRPLSPSPNDPLHTLPARPAPIWRPHTSHTTFTITFSSLGPRNCCSPILPSPSAPPGYQHSLQSR